MTTSTKNEVKNQVDLLTEFTEMKDISNDSAASIQGGYVNLYDLRNQKVWLGKFHWGSKKLSSRANDDVSSIYIQEGTWDFFEHKNYRGRRIRLSAAVNGGKYNLRDYGFDQKMSSLRRVS